MTILTEASEVEVIPAPTPAPSEVHDTTPTQAEDVTVTDEPISELPATYALPEDFVLLEGFGDKVNTLGRDLGLTQEKFDQLTGMYSEIEMARLDSEQAARIDAVAAIMPQEQLKTFEAKAKATFGEDYEVLRDAASGSMTAPASVIKLVQKYMLKQEHSPMGQIQQAPQLTEGDLREMMKDSRYQSDREYQAKVAEGFRKLYN